MGKTRLWRHVEIIGLYRLRYLFVSLVRRSRNSEGKITRENNEREISPDMWYYGVYGKTWVQSFASVQEYQASEYNISKKMRGNNE